MMIHYRKDENGNIILSEYMFNRLMKHAHNKEKENKILNNIINELENELYKFYAYEGYNDEQIKDKIKELKGSDR